MSTPDFVALGSFSDFLKSEGMLAAQLFPNTGCDIGP